MPWWKVLLLQLYLRGTGPGRRRFLRELCEAGRAPVLVVAHHRIADSRPNAWTCPNGVFLDQVRWARDRFDLVTLEEAQRRLREGASRPALALTFDDGYAENLDRAFPFLLDQGIPFTCFITLHHVMTGQPYDHDTARGDRFRTLTIDEVRDLARRGVEIGAHTRTHADLAKVTDPAVLHDEVTVAGRDLAAAAGCRVRYFAFAYGWHSSMTPAAFHAAREAGYDAVCSCYGGYNLPGEDPFHLQRFGGPDLLVRFQNWATLDPRKQLIQRFRY